MTVPMSGDDVLALVALRAMIGAATRAPVASGISLPVSGHARVESKWGFPQ